METKYQKFPGKHFSFEKNSGFTVNLKFFRKYKKGVRVSVRITFYLYI